MTFKNFSYCSLTLKKADLRGLNFANFLASDHSAGSNKFVAFIELEKDLQTFDAQSKINYKSVKTYKTAYVLLKPLTGSKSWSIEKIK